MKTRKIALCIPNLSWQASDDSVRWHIVPYGLCLIAATIKDLCTVDIIDANMDNLSPAAFHDRIRDGNYDLVGVSVLMDGFAECGMLAAELARNAATIPSAPIVMGGVFPTIHPERVISSPAVDYVVIGEGEEAFRALLMHLWRGAPLPAKGLAYIDADGRPQIQPKADPILDLDSLPLPAYELIDFGRYARNEPRKAVAGSALLPYAHILTSRGCPFHCSYCQVESISGRRFRPRSPDAILDEVAWLKNTYGVKSLLIDDDNIVTDRKRAVELFQGMIDRDLVMPWKAPAVAVFLLDEELIDLMARAGCVFIGIAIESGSQRILRDVINKPVNLEHAARMMAHAKKRGIFTSANYMIGFPTETWAEIRQTIRAAEDLDTDYVKIFTVIPLRGTRLWDLCVSANAISANFDPEKVSWNEGQIISDQFTSGELTLLRAYEWDRINFATSEKRERIRAQMSVSMEELETIRRNTRSEALKRLRASDGPADANADVGYPKGKH